VGRVAITGLGILSALGRGIAAHQEALRAPRSPFSGVTRFSTQGIPESPAAQVQDELFTQLPHDSRTDALALTAATDALEDAAFGAGSTPERGLIVLGTTTGGLDRSEGEYLRAGMSASQAVRDAGRRHSAGAVADRIAQRLLIQGERHTFSTACSSSANALGFAAQKIHAGAPWALAGGVDALCALTYYGFQALRLLSPTPCQPFNRQRLGLSLGEGAAFAVLEPEASARARGARVWAYLEGWGCSADAHHMTAPEPSGRGAADAVRMALAAARLTPERIDYVNAHGTGTAANDRAESLALNAVFGERCPQVSSTKAMTGHTLGASGAIEAALTALSLSGGFLPPTLRLDDADPELRLAFVPPEGLRGDFQNAVSTSFGFGGNNAALVLSRGQR
jgi:3-oxoacyl-[acyl-carrier-protein] synthase II